MKQYDRTFSAKLRTLRGSAPTAAILAICMPLFCGQAAVAQGDSATQDHHNNGNGADDLRWFIDQQVGGLKNLKDGLMPSGEAIDDNEPLTRRDEGIDPPIDVTSATSYALVNRDLQAGEQSDIYSIKNKSAAIIDTNLLVIAEGLPKGVRLIGPHTGVTSSGAPYLRVYLTNGVLNPGESTVQTLNFKVPKGSAPLRYSLDLRSGQGNP